MEHPAVDLLDLPDEILLIIMKRITYAEVLYSFLGVNKRLDKLARSLTCTKCLDFSSISSTRREFPFDNYDVQVVDRYCRFILPEIDQKLEELIINQWWMKDILFTGQYPNLRKISIRNYWPHLLSRDLTEESLMARLFREQITHITLSVTPGIASNIEFTDGCARIFSACKQLTFFDASRQSYAKHSQLILYDQPRTICSSSQLRILFVNLSHFDECICLLDGRLNQLSSFTANIKFIGRRIIVRSSMNILPNLTEFSLTSHAITDGYDDQIVRLLRRMINLKNLALYLNIRRRVFIDRIHFDRMIFHRMSQLNSFTFHISTTMSTYNTNQLLSANDIQNTFNDWKYSSVHCSVYYFANQLAVSHIYSTTAKRTCIPFITKRFHRIPFQSVTDLKLYGTYSFEHHFFEWIARTFPLLKYFTLHNLTLQENEGENDKQISSYLHLIKLDLMNIHIDYALQFLCHTNTYVPNLHTLMIQYEQLRTVTNNFTSDLTRNNCRQVKRLLTNELIEYPKDFDLYFPCLKK